MILSYWNNKGADQPAHPCSLISVFAVHCLDSSKRYSSIGTYTVSPTCQFAESVLSLHVHLFKYIQQEPCHTDSGSLCTDVDVDFL